MKNIISAICIGGPMDGAAFTYEGDSFEVCEVQMPYWVVTRNEIRYSKIEPKASKYRATEITPEGRKIWLHESIILPEAIDKLLLAYATYIGRRT